MDNTEAPSREELVQRASDLVPLIREHADWAEENRRLHDDVVTALTDSGLLKMRVPLRYDGYESDMRTVVDVIAELSRGDGSAGWTVSVWAISAWMVGLFPDKVQKEIFTTPGVRVSGILSPTAVGIPTEGGIILNGQWRFNSGSQQAHWNTNAAVRIGPDGQPEPIMVAIPMSDLEVIDDWNTAGLRGTGSVTTAAKDVFVPDERVLSLVPVLTGQHQAEMDTESLLYRAPFMPTACATISGPAVGLARAAKEAFFERLPGRKITYTDYENQAEAPLTHLQVAEATTKIAEAEFHAYTAADLVDAKSLAGEEWTLEERARVRLHLGAVCARVKEAVDVLTTASGGSSVYLNVPIQRIERDVQTLNLHAILHPNTNLELYGRIQCGLGPNTHYI